MFDVVYRSNNLPTRHVNIFILTCIEINLPDWFTLDRLRYDIYHERGIKVMHVVLTEQPILFRFSQLFLLFCYNVFTHCNYAC